MGGIPQESSSTMSRVPPFYSHTEATTRAAQRLYHTNSACFVGQSIPYHDRRQGQATDFSDL